MRQFFSKFIKLFKILYEAKYKFKFPHQRHTIVLDLDNSYYFVKLFKKNKTFFLDTRMKELNIIVLVYSIFKCLLKININLSKEYIINYIKFVNPKNIVTFTDNNIFFLKLKNIFKQKNLIVFQYAWRSRLTFDDMYFETRKTKFFEKFKIDYTCIWGENSKFFYSKFLDTKYLTTGSIKNNFFRYEKKLKKDSIIFISQFRMHFDYNQETKTYKKNNFKDIAIKNILNYCLKNNFKLKILGCAKENSLYEKNYFNKLLGEKNFTFLKRNGGLSSYEHSQNYKFFITFCSSLAYELMTRGKRVAFLPWKDQFVIRNKKIKFSESFYTNKKKTGSIWSNSSSRKEVFRVLNFISKTKENYWKSIQKKLINPIITYDRENKMTKKLFNELGIN